jgi:hypothetical protein
MQRPEADPDLHDIRASKINWTKWGVIIAAIPILLTIAVMFCKYHERFALADSVCREDEAIVAKMYKIRDNVNQVTIDFHYYALTNQAAEIQKRMWYLLDVHKCSNSNQLPQTAKQEYRRLEEERRRLLKKAERLKK